MLIPVLSYTTDHPRCTRLAEIPHPDCSEHRTLHRYSMALVSSKHATFVGHAIIVRSVSSQRRCDPPDSLSTPYSDLRKSASSRFRTCICTLSKGKTNQMYKSTIIRFRFRVSFIYAGNSKLRLTHVHNKNPSGSRTCAPKAPWSRH